MRTRSPSGTSGTAKPRASSVLRARHGLEAQARDLKAAGAEKVVTKPDWLARSTAEPLSIEADLTKRGVGLVVLHGWRAAGHPQPDQQADARGVDRA